jgi:hypothetical protein
MRAILTLIAGRAAMETRWLHAMSQQCARHGLAQPADDRVVLRDDDEPMLVLHGLDDRRLVEGA